MAASWSATLTDHAGVVAASPDGALVALGSLGGDACVVEVGTGQVADHPMGVLAAAWSRDGRHLAVGGQDGVLRLYRPGGASVAVVQLDGWVTSIEWSPGGLAAVGAGRSLTILEPDGTVSHRYPDQPSTVTAVAWSVDGTRVGAAAYGGVRWYDPAPDLEPSGPARTFAWKGSLLSLAVSPTGKWACGGAQDATVHIWRPVDERLPDEDRAPRVPPRWPLAGRRLHGRPHRVGLPGPGPRRHPARSGRGP
jgi:WD40 repeat protein